MVDRIGLVAADPGRGSRPVGKEKRVRGILSWAIEHDPARGSQFVARILSELRGVGGFRVGSPNFVGQEPISDAIDAFAREGFELGRDGDLRPRIAQSLAGRETTVALRAYVRRIRSGHSDAALVVGTGKDLLEATAAHVLVERRGSYPTNVNFRSLLGLAYVSLGLATPEDALTAHEGPRRQIERHLFEIACAVNALRNRQGTGHGRPWLPSLDDAEARRAAESMALVADLLLEQLARR